jgi:hypothetical protein
MTHLGHAGAVPCRLVPGQFFRPTIKVLSALSRIPRRSADLVPCEVILTGLGAAIAARRSRVLQAVGGRIRLYPNGRLAVASAGASSGAGETS